MNVIRWVAIVYVLICVVSLVVALVGAVPFWIPLLLIFCPGLLLLIVLGIAAAWVPMD
jgi:hypothetical protein